MNEADYKELKKGGMMRQAEAGLFSVRLHVVGGRLDTPQLRAIREAADRFGRGEVHLTSRQGVEIPYVPQDSLAALKEFLAPSGVGVGVCGPTVRTVTACQGCRVCPSGVIDSPALAEAVDRELYGKPVPHKFKVGISGCVNNCMKAEENDVGIKGWIEPRWDSAGLHLLRGLPGRLPDEGDLDFGGRPRVDRRPVRCASAAATASPPAPPGACARRSAGTGSSPAGSSAGARSSGSGSSGSCGRRRRRWRRSLAVLDFFREHGKPRERFGDTLQRTGFPALETFVKERTGLP